MNETLTTSQLLAASAEILESSGYEPVSDHNVANTTSRLFEDLYGIVSIVGFETWTALAETWQDSQGKLVELISTHISRPEPKAWEGYLVLMTPGVVPLAARSVVADIRYDTNRVRKLVATGDELRTLDDVEQTLLPLLPLAGSSHLEGGGALLDRLPALLETRGVDSETARIVIDAFLANESIPQRLLEARTAR